MNYRNENVFITIKIISNLLPVTSISWRQQQLSQAPSSSSRHGSVKRKKIEKKKKKKGKMSRRTKKVEMRNNFLCTAFSFSAGIRRKEKNEK